MGVCGRPQRGVVPLLLGSKPNARGAAASTVYARPRTGHRAPGESHTAYDHRTTRPCAPASEPVYGTTR